MTSQQDKDDLLDALYARGQKTGKRPSIWEAQMDYLPEWDRDRLFEAAQGLLDDGSILNPTRGLVNVDISSTARKNATTRTAPSAASPTTVNNYSNSNVQNVAAGGKGVQNNYNQNIKNDLREIIDLYKENIDSLSLSPSERSRADAQVATIEAQLQDEPNPVIINAAGKSLKTIIEGGLGGALGSAIASPGVWAGLISLFS